MKEIGVTIFIPANQIVFKKFLIFGEKIKIWTPHKGLESFAAQHGLIHKGLILDKYHHFSHSRIRRRSTFETDYDFGNQVEVEI